MSIRPASGHRHHVLFLLVFFFRTGDFLTGLALGIGFGFDDFTGTAQR